MKTASCPICRRPVRDAQHKPFCTARCKDVDLHRWLSESYRVPANPDPDDEADEGEADEGEDGSGAGASPSN